MADVPVIAPNPASDREGMSGVGRSSTSTATSCFGSGLTSTVSGALVRVKPGLTSCENGFSTPVDSDSSCSPFPIEDASSLIAHSSSLWNGLLTSASSDSEAFLS